ncbi:hypothetical protein BLNAU_7998 [Blattamonas nauphoetae]|uniref:Uncharacterized protein n=1 Tax=Blattamonas nauphoetae TaxID=2049346 RepID=A0ABQ9XZM4_9EUKA|nr:hypothetical protein BLNAU_7998 [Blattamonas nauphoetae]
MSKLALKTLSTQSKADSETRSFLRTLKVPSDSTDSSSELVPFAGRLCSTLAELVSEMKSLFSESSPLDGTISALTTTLPEESTLLIGNTVLAILCEELFFINTLFSDFYTPFVEILIKFTFVPLLKSTIITCLDLLDHEKNESNCPPSDRTDLLIKVLVSSWDCVASTLSRESLSAVVKTTFSDIPLMCSLLERTYHHSSSTHSSHLEMIINFAASLHLRIPRLLEENLVDRVIDTFNPMAVPTTHAQFHNSFIQTLIKLINRETSIRRGTDRKRFRIILFERGTGEKPHRSISKGFFRSCCRLSKKSNPVTPQKFTAGRSTHHLDEYSTEEISGFMRLPRESYCRQDNPLLSHHLHWGRRSGSLTITPSLSLLAPPFCGDFTQLLNLVTITHSIILDLEQQFTFDMSAAWKGHSESTISFSHSQSNFSTSLSYCSQPQTIGIIRPRAPLQYFNKSIGMTVINEIAYLSSSTARAIMSIPQLPFATDCSPFLNWREDSRDSIHSKAVIFRSLVATLKSQPALDVSFEAKAVKFLQDVEPLNEPSADAFLDSFESSSDDSLTSFVQSIVILISSTNPVITATTMAMLYSLVSWSSLKPRLSLIRADLIHELIMTLHPQSLSFAEAVDIHINVMKSLTHCFWLTTPGGLAYLEIEDSDEQHAVRETVFQQVLTPSEKYIWHLCVDRYSIVDSDMSNEFMILLDRLLEICPSYQQTMDFVLHIPVFLTIPSCLTFFENDESIYYSLSSMIHIQREWSKTRGVERQMGKTVIRMLRMEGIEDVIEAKLRNDETYCIGQLIVTDLIEWNNLQGLNLSE